jgi:hypothetical protein
VHWPHWSVWSHFVQDLTFLLLLLLLLLLPQQLLLQVDGIYQDGGFNWSGTFIRVWHGEVEGLRTTFLEPENGHFWRGCIYGRNDDHVR